jgi:glycosyltransferase involved in cell wall biosynthesis
MEQAQNQGGAQKMTARPKLTLDIGPMLDDQWTGIPVFTSRLAQCLLRHGGIDVEFSVQLTKIPQPLVQSAINAGSGTMLHAGLERANFDGYELIDRYAPLLFPTAKNASTIGQREASTVHDLSTLVMPEVHEDANVMHHMNNFNEDLATDDAVFCVSESTRAALQLYYPSVAPKTRILYQYVEWPESYAAIERNLPKLQLGRYALVVGTLEPRKNLGLLIRALSMPEVRRSSIRFIVMGKKGWKVDHVLAELAPEDASRIIFSGFVSEFVKYRLMRGAEFLVYPSIYEGFGIPALEAMSLGKPVLASMTSSFPEIIGDAGVFFDPLSSAEFAAAFTEMSHKRRQAELAPKALAVAAAFNWQRMAAPVVEWVRQ